MKSIHHLGISGRIAAAFQANAITPLLALVALLLGLLGYAPIKAIQLWHSPAAIRLLDAARVPLAALFGLAGLQLIQEESASFWPFVIGTALAPLLGYLLYRRSAV